MEEPEQGTAGSQSHEREPLPHDSAESFDPQPILERLDNAYRHIPVREIGIVLMAADRFKPLLIERMYDAARAIRNSDKQLGCLPHLSVYLLAAMRATEAFPAFLELVTGPPDKLARLFGETIPAFFERAFAILGKDRVEQIESLLTDVSVNHDVRWAAATSLAYLARDGHLAREAAIEILSRALKLALANQDSRGVTFLAFELTGYGPTEKREEILQLYSTEYLDQDLCHYDVCRKTIDRGMASFQEMCDLFCPTNVDDILTELEEWWGIGSSSSADGSDAEGYGGSWSSDSNRWDDDEWDDDEWDEYEEELDEDAWDVEDRTADTIVNRQARIGRNEPCPCGSGKKFKKCCGRR